MRKAATLLFLLAFFGSAAAARAPGSLEHLAGVFCQSHGDIGIGARAPYLSPDLVEAIAAAESANQGFIDVHPDEKPPLGDGIPWQSAPDLAEICIPGSPHVTGNEARLTISYEFPDYPEANYADRLWLVRIGGRWFIDDISYDHGGLSLRDLLDRIAAAATE